MTVNICGIPHKIIFCEDSFQCGDTHFGEIDYGKAEIKVNSALSAENQQETICHEIVHGIFVHIGRQDLAEDEILVQALANAINQSFAVKYKENKAIRISSDEIEIPFEVKGEGDT